MPGLLIDRRRHLKEEQLGEGTSVHGLLSLGIYIVGKSI